MTDNTLWCVLQGSKWARAGLAAVGAFALCAVALLGVYTNKAGPSELMMKVRNNRRVGLMAQQPKFVRGSMTASQFKVLLENEEEHNVMGICGAATCKAYKGCNMVEFSECLTMDGLERQRFVVASLPSLNLMEGPLGDLPDEPSTDGILAGLPADTTAAQCGTDACTAEGCDDAKFFACFAARQTQKMAFAEEYPKVCVLCGAVYVSRERVCV